MGWESGNISKRIKTLYWLQVEENFGLGVLYGPYMGFHVWTGEILKKWWVTSFEKQFFEEQQLSHDKSFDGDGGKGYTTEIIIDFSAL